MDFLALAQNRYSLRRMSDKKVSEDDIRKILEAARLAPTAKNRQEERFIIASSDEDIEKIRMCTNCHFNAPTIIIICYKKEYDENGNETHESVEYGKLDIGIVAAHMCLEITDLGLGSTMVGLFDKEKLVELFNIDTNIYEPVLLLPIGYSDNKGPSHLHEKRMSIEDYIIK